VNFGCFVLRWTTPTSASLKPDKRSGFDLQCQLHPRAGASLQFPEGTGSPVRPEPARGAQRPSPTPPTPIKPRRRHVPRTAMSDEQKAQPLSGEAQRLANLKPSAKGRSGKADNRRTSPSSPSAASTSARLVNKPVLGLTSVDCGLSLAAQRPPGCRSVVYPGREADRGS
jgi:hypothetical protein